MSMTYKPEIDGLRTLAVGLVLLCHMQLGFTGGYVGVDVFFVISGFLITSNVLGSVQLGRFSIWTFYGKRFIRLYPALIATVIICFIIGFLLADPMMLALLARTGKYALLSASNIFFSSHQGYFDQGANKQVFLHTWSLGVEWQFYLLWPLIICLAMKVSRKLLIGLLCGITLLSIIVSSRMVDMQPTQAYYFMPYRAFELGIGALVVFFYRYTLKPVLSATLTLAGLAMIILCGVIYTAKTPFPGYDALWPCIGTAMCIFGSKGFIQANILRTAPMVYIGKISYSLYLVHWPLVVFYQYYVFRELFWLEKIILVIVAVLLGAALYHGVEQRFNWKNINHKKAGCLLMLALIAVLALILHMVNRNGSGLPWRLGEKQNLYSENYISGGAPTHTTTIFGTPDGQRMAYLMGDSFAAHLYNGIQHNLSTKKQYIQAIYEFGCFTAPLYPQFGPPSDKRSHCADIYAQGIAAIKANPAPLIIAQDWQLYYAWEPFDNNENNRFASIQLYGEFLQQHLARLQQDIGDNKLIIMAAPHYYRNRYNAAECLMRPNWLPQVCTKQVYAPYRYEDSPAYAINQQLKAYALSHKNAYFIDMNPTLCPNGLCEVERDIQNYNDGRHFSRTGSRLVVDAVMPQIEQIITTPKKQKSTVSQNLPRHVHTQ